MVNTPNPNPSKISKPVIFHTAILQTGKNTTGIEVPEDVLEKLGGGKRPLVKVKVNDYDYRSAVAVMDGKYMISMSAEHRQAGGFQGGDVVVVTLQLDLEPRTVELPEDLKTALVKSNVMGAFEKSAPSMQKEYVRWVQEAKAPETRERRIAKTVEKLKGV
jgi:Bacteriocin-protection, YdeI or OmpD-Associated/Domain of unknown function (DUF1905)